MMYRCPFCDHDFDAVELRQPAGLGGGSYCPKCQERVRISFPYGGLVAFVSVLIAIGILALAHVRTIFGYVIGTVLIWIPLSLALNAATVRFKVPTLKKWKQRRRTFFEWLYERDTPPELIDKRR